MVASTFDEPTSRHVAVTEMVIEKQKVGKDMNVVILLNNYKMGRAYNTVIPSSGKVLTGGVDAMHFKGQKIFGAARNVEEGGSLTIISQLIIQEVEWMKLFLKNSRNRKLNKT